MTNPSTTVAIDRVFAAHVGPRASMVVHAVFSVHDLAEVPDLMGTAGFDEVETETDTVPLRVALPAEFFWQYVHSTPLAAIVGELDDAARVALEHDVVERANRLWTATPP